MRNVLMTFVFFSYTSLMLTSQAMASYMYCGTVSLDSMLGTESIKAFDGNTADRFQCLHAHSPDARGKWEKDDAPIACIVQTWSISGWVVHREFGVGNKTEEDDAVENEMDQFTGRFGNKFNLEKSF